MKSAKDQIRSMLTVEPQPTGFRATLNVNPDFTILPDHFAAAPIFPGMCIVQAVLIAASIAINQPTIRLKTLKNAKLMHPILPGDTVTIQADTTQNLLGQLIIKAKITCAEKRRAEISLIAESQPQPKAIPA